VKYISKHNPKEEGKCNACEYSRIEFKISRYSVSIDNSLENTSEFVDLEEGRSSLFLMSIAFLELTTRMALLGL